MNFERTIWPYLIDWKSRANRKPIVLRGARQVGKTTLVKQLAKTYKHSILLNLEKENDKSYFDQFNNAKTLIQALLLSRNIPPAEVNNTLLFIDEIQESPDAIGMLRYFYEDVPELHVIAAGSLLEFAIRKIKNFPVGRIEYLYLHPFNFLEFLQAIGHKAAVQELTHVPIRPFAHKTLLQLFHTYAIIGGMPEVVQTYTSDKTMLSLPRIYESIWATYQNDVEKYATNETERKVIKHIISTAHLYLDQRIKFQNFGNSTYRSREVGEAFRNLDDAKIIRLIYPTTDLQAPVKPDIRKAPRMQFLDTGLVNHTLGIQPNLLALNDLSNELKGALVPHLITQELMSINNMNSTKPHFWARDKKQSSAEVDLVYTHYRMVIPIEVKSGSSGSLKSLHQFVDESDHPYAMRIFGGEFSVQHAKTPKGTPYILMNLPYYLGTQLPGYVAHLVSEYKLENDLKTQ